MGREYPRAATAGHVVGRCAECGEGVDMAGGVCYQCGELVYHDYCLDGISRRRLFFEFEIERDKLLEAAGFRELAEYGE